jgi:hypothetical protein
MAELEKDWEELDQIMSTAAKSNSADINEVSFLAARTQEAERSLEHEQKRIDELRRVADQQAIAGPIIGLFSIARSTCAIVSYYGYRTDKVAANRISFAGRVSQSLGQTYSLVATPVAKIRYVIYTRKLAKEGRLPTQVYQKRLKYLADLEKQIKADHPL